MDGFSQLVFPLKPVSILTMMQSQNGAFCRRMLIVLLCTIHGKSVYNSFIIKDQGLIYSKILQKDGV